MRFVALNIQKLLQAAEQSASPLDLDRRVRRELQEFILGHLIQVIIAQAGSKNRKRLCDSMQTL
jgi:hypothetical protein